MDFLVSRRMETAPTFTEPHDTTSLRATCPSVYSTWQSQAVTHPIMNRARRCLTSVIEPTPMSERRIPYTDDDVDCLNAEFPSVPRYGTMSTRKV